MAKGGRREGAGRPKGSKDKIPQKLKDRVLKVADHLERKGLGLDVEAEKDPKWFYQNFLKVMLPKEIDATIDTGDTLTEIIRKIVK